jgi:hypothetical protein
VNPYIGTGSLAYGIGHNNPGAQHPFAPLRLGPDTSYGPVHIQWQHYSGYVYRHVPRTPPLPPPPAIPLNVATH